MDRMDFRGRGERRSHLVRLDRCCTAGLAWWCVAAMRSQSAVDRCQAGEAWNTDWETHREIKKSKESNRFQTLQFKKQNRLHSQVITWKHIYMMIRWLLHDGERSEAEPAPRSWNSLLGGQEPPSLSSFPCLSFFFFFFYYIIPASRFQLQPEVFVYSPQESCVCLKPWFWCYSNVSADSPSVPCAFWVYLLIFRLQPDGGK